MLHFFVTSHNKTLIMKKVFAILFVIFVLIQFFQIDKTNPPVNKGMDFLTIKNTPESTATLIRNSCYDCHSNETTYPWYSYVQPLGWFLNNHIKDGRKHLNFSTFATYEAKRQAHKMEESAEMIEKNEMPMESYIMIHSDAKLSAEQQKTMIDYFKSIQAETAAAGNL